MVGATDWQAIADKRLPNPPMAEQVSHCETGLRPEHPLGDQRIRSAIFFSLRPSVEGGRTTMSEKPPSKSAKLQTLIHRRDKVLAVLHPPTAAHARIMEKAGCEALFVGTGGVVGAFRGQLHPESALQALTSKAPLIDAKRITRERS
jgi:hypothetical protein